MENKDKQNMTEIKELLAETIKREIKSLRDDDYPAGEYREVSRSISLLIDHYLQLLNMG